MRKIWKRYILFLTNSLSVNIAANAVSRRVRLNFERGIFMRMKRIIVMLLVFSILSLSGCWLEDGGYVRERLTFYDFQEFKDFIKENAKGDYVYLAFDFDDNIVTSEVYTIDVTAQIKKDTVYYMSSANVFGRFEFKRSDSKLEVVYSFEHSQNERSIDENSTYKIELVSNSDIEEMFGVTNNSPSYPYQYNYALYCDEEAIAHIVVSSEQEESEECLFDICQLLLNNLILIA